MVFAEPPEGAVVGDARPVVFATHHQTETIVERYLRRGGRLPYPQRLFIESWSRRIGELVPDKVAGDAGLRTLVTEREWRLKGARARLRSRNRLLDWTLPRAGAGRRGSRMDFRWFRARQLLIDLHRGFAA